MLVYETPSLPLLLTISAFLYIINISEACFKKLLNAGLLGSLATGIVFGPQASNIIPDDVQNTFIVLGYIGLILLVFEAGISTDISLLFRNIFLSATVALTGVVLPIVFSLLLLHFAFGYSPLRAFAAGAALCSTSLGTTLALLHPDLRQTRTGSVLLSAALLDDIAGLVIAAIIPNLTLNGAGAGITWTIIVRPILVSFAFAALTPAAAYLSRGLFVRFPSRWKSHMQIPQVQLLSCVGLLSGFVAGARYAGTSELFGSYLAGAFWAYIFKPYPLPDNESLAAPPTPHLIFTIYLHPILQVFLSPIFFASIGAALPIRSLVSINGSHRVVWRGIVYSLLMVLAKALVGVWIYIWPNPDEARGWCGCRRIPKHKLKPKSEGEEDKGNVTTLPRFRSASLLGLAMVARGEIALIVAQLAKPLLMDDPGQDNSEPFAVVIWAVLLSTVGGAVFVGCLLRSWR